MPRRNSGYRLRFLDKRGCYYVVWTEGGRSRERSTGTRDLAQAQIALGEFIRKNSRTAGPRDPSEIQVTDILAEYAEDRAQDAAAPWRIGYAIDALTDFWRNRTVAEITRETCRRYGSTRSRSSGTVRRELGVLRAAVNLSHREGRLTRPVHVTLPDAPAPREKWLTRSQAAALLRAARGEPSVRLYLPLFILIAAYTGQRKQAILSLRWSQIDLTAGYDISPAPDAIVGRIDFNTPGARRTNKRRARIPIPRKLLGHLRRARKRGTDLGYVISEDGHRIGDIKKGFAAACRRAGLSGVTPHVLRHTCATWLMQQGVQLWEAAGFLGMTPETLERVYGHHHPEFMGNAARALS
jgi:integrase